MNLGCVFVWHPESDRLAGGHLHQEIVPLLDLARDGDGRFHLSSPLVRVKNGGFLLEPAANGRGTKVVALGNAGPDSDGNFIFRDCTGGARVDRFFPLPAPEQERLEYVEASRFGEVNTYYHLHKIASYVNELLDALRLPRLPQVTAVVNAHAEIEHRSISDGASRRSEDAICFQGGHYRLPGGSSKIPEIHPISAHGEIHLGPGRKLLEAGALADYAARTGDRYRKNASHILGIIYHEYGHHITRHLADFRGNRLRAPDRQDNLKTALDEGISDYWAAVMMETPHIWACHKLAGDPRSLSSSKSMDDFDSEGDPHENGTIWAATVWDLRRALKSNTERGDRKTDNLILKMLNLIGAESISGKWVTKGPNSRGDFAIAATMLLRADEILYSGQFRHEILTCLSVRGIEPISKSLGNRQYDAAHVAI